MCRIMIVEDDQTINMMEKRLLEKNNYETISAFSGTEAILLLEKEKVDLVLLDLMLPGLSGETVLGEIIRKYDIPIICVSAKDELDTRLSMMREGADDYIMKPFHNDELLVRIETVLRRSHRGGDRGKGNEADALKFKDMIMHQDSHVVMVGQCLVELTVKEYDILRLLLENPQKVFTKQNIFDSVWNEDYYADDNAVTVHVSNLRNKLCADKDRYIKTVWGIGYKMQEE